MKIVEGSFCTQCKKPRDRQGQIIERDRQGRITGRVLYLCKLCEIDFYKREIQEVTKIFKGIAVNPNKLYDWNRNKADV